MGKTAKPLSLMVDADLIETPEIQELVAKGHEVIRWKPEGVDIVFSPRAWRMTPELGKYIPLSIKAARKRKYPKKEV